MTHNGKRNHAKVYGSVSEVCQREHDVCKCLIQKFILQLWQRGLNVQLINEIGENIQNKRTIQENVQKHEIFHSEETHDSFVSKKLNEKWK